MSIDRTDRATEGRIEAAAADRDLASLYRSYNACCNEHAFERLGEYVASRVSVNGAVQGLEAYVAGLEAVVAAFPDYRWNVRHLLIDPPWIAAHFIDTGTHRGEFMGIPATGRKVSTQEFALYRVEGGKFVEVWVTADNVLLLEQLRT